MSATVTRHGDRLHVKTPFHLKDTVKEIPGRLWNKDGKVWTLPATPTAAANARTRLEEHGLHVDQAVLELLATAEAQTAALVHKTAETLDDFPARTEAWLHQRQAFWFAHSRDAAMLAMDMGTGKSKVFIGLCDSWDIDVAVILAPVKACRVWPREFHGGDIVGFDGHSLRPWVVVNGLGIIGGHGKVLKNPSMKTRVQQARDAITDAVRRRAPVAIVVNYEAAWQDPFKTFLKGIRKEAEKAYGRPVKTALGCDESHKIKAPNGAWSKFAASLGKNFDKRLALTGTPNPHSEPDLYAQFRVLDSGVFGTNFSQFKTRFFDMGGFEGREITGWRSDAAQREFIEQFASMAYICDSDDVLDLPDVHELPPYTTRLGDEAAKHYASMEADFYTEIMRDRGEDSEGEPVMAPSSLTQLLRLAQITSGHLPVGDKDLGTHEVVTIGTEKAKLLADVLDDLPANEPLVIFGRFHHDMKTIREAVEATGRTYAEISGRKGQVDGLTADATMNPDVDVVGVQLQAGGVGIDLTRARYAIYYALDFNLGDYKQSRKRVHRPGQTRPVTFIYLACEGTVDETIGNALRNRDAVLTALKNAAKNYDHTEGAS